METGIRLTAAERTAIPRQPAWGRLAEMILTDSQPGSGSQWTHDSLSRGHSLVAPARNLPALASGRAADEQEDAGHAAE